MVIKIIFLFLLSLRSWAGEDVNLSFLAYKPTYMISGKSDTKGQASFKYRLFEQKEWMLGSKNIILWDVERTSSPFLDTNYNPELFYQWQTSKDFLHQIDLGILDHESNGKSGHESRSANRLFVTLNMKGVMGPHAFKFSPRFFYHYSIDQATPDYRRYASFLELNFSLMGIGRVFDYDELMLRITPGGQYAHEPALSGYEVSYFFKLPKLNFRPLIFLQYYKGYKESMLFYNQSRESIRLGLMLD